MPGLTLRYAQSIQQTRQLAEALGDPQVILRLERLERRVNQTGVPPGQILLELTRLTDELQDRLEDLQRGG